MLEKQEKGGQNILQRKLSRLCELANPAEAISAKTHNQENKQEYPSSCLAANTATHTPFWNKQIRLLLQLPATRNLRFPPVNWIWKPFEKESLSV